MEKYLQPTFTFDSDSEPIREKAQQLTQGLTDPMEKAKAIFYFVRDGISYNLYVKKHMPEHFQASSTLLRGKGYCVQKSVLLIALARAVGIPARLGCAKIKNHLLSQKVMNILQSNIFPWHGYAELYLDGTWVKATPAFDLKMCQDNKLVPVEFDGRSNAMFPEYSQEGKPHIEYLLDRGPYDDIPLEEIRKALIERNLIDPKDLADLGETA